MVHVVLSGSSGPGWISPTLMVIFIIHTLAFAYMYYKRRNPLTIMLIVAFPLLAAYYALLTFGVSFRGMSAIRWVGIVLATIPVLLMLYQKIRKRMKRVSAESE